MKVKDEMMRLMELAKLEGFDKDIDYSIFEDKHGVIGKPSNPELEKQIFGFSVSDKNFK